MTGLLALGGHEFWPDDATLFDTEGVDTSRLLDSKQVTDTYLLALARSHGGKLATFDRRMVTAAVTGGAKALCCIE